MQHINLYSQLEKYVEPPFSARQQVLLLAALLGLFVFIYVGLLWQQSTWRQDFSTLKSQQDQLIAEVDALNTRKAAEENNAELKADIARLENGVKFRKQLLASIDPDAQREATGFAEHLSGLARQQIAGLWFTEINLMAQGKQMALSGYAQKPEFLPQYLQNLSGEQVFSGKQFNVLRLNQADKYNNAMRFEVRTHARGDSNE